MLYQRVLYYTIYAPFYLYCFFFFNLKALNAICSVFIYVSAIHDDDIVFQ